MTYELTKKYSLELGKAKHLDIDKLQQKLERVVMIALNDLYSIRDFEAVKIATKKLAEQIINYKNRYQKQPTTHIKQEFLRKSCFEESKRPELTKALEKTFPGEKSNDPLSFESKLDRLLAIESRIIINEFLYHSNSSMQEKLAELSNNDNKIKILTAEHIKQGMGYIKANFIATEVMKHQERYGVQMSLKQLNHLKTIGDYVEHNFESLQKSGFSAKEARIAYNEGSNLMHYSDIRIKNSVIARSEVIAVQKDSINKMDRMDRLHSQRTLNQSRGINISMEI